MDVVLRADDIPENGLYNRDFHILDICKDATEATPPILKNTRNPRNLYEDSMMTLFNTRDNIILCRSYKGALHTLETAATTEGAIVKQINRLTSPLGLDTGIPQSIEKCIRDSGPSASSFNPAITILFNPSDYTDPSSRTEVPPVAEKFPVNGGTFHIGDDVFDRIIGVSSPVRNFSATMMEDNTCRVGFSIVIGDNTYNYQTIISSNFQQGTENGGEFFTTTGVPPQPAGNPKKNTFFNNNNAKYNALLQTNKHQEAEDILARAIAYIVSKEYFGDILIAMVALKYKETGANNAAIFTSDNALTAICKMWNLNVVSKNWNRSSSTEESVAILYNANPAEELRRNKEQIKLSVTRWNRAISERLQYVVNSVRQIKHLGDITEGQKKFIRSIIEYIERINAVVSEITNDEDLPIFRKEVVKYQIKNMIHSIEGETVTFVRGIKHMFRTVPDTVAGKIDIPGEFVETLQRMRGNARPPFRVYTTRVRLRGGQRGGTLDDIDRDPTRVLKSIIARNISLEIRNNTQANIKPTIDDEKQAIDDIYNYLYFLYNLECKICFDEGIIRTLISGYLGDIQELSYDELIDEYNGLLRHTMNVETNVENIEEIPRIKATGNFSKSRPPLRMVGFRNSKKLTKKRGMYKANSLNVSNALNEMNVLNASKYGIAGGSRKRTRKIKSKNK